mgnify:CR=1 FL=1|jgi:hypothetical protein
MSKLSISKHRKTLAMVNQAYVPRMKRPGFLSIDTKQNIYGTGTSMTTFSTKNGRSSTHAKMLEMPVPSLKAPFCSPKGSMESGL